MLVSRAELTAVAERAEAASAKGDDEQRASKALLAASIRRRLTEGDFQVGDRVVVTIVTDAARSDTVAVRSGKVLELRDKILVPVDGVLRSELKDRVSVEVLKYIKAREIQVVPLMRVGILGDVAKPGYFALASDLPITDAIMSAGGPTGAADLQRSIVRRGNEEFRSAAETRRAIAGGLTLDQFGLSAGDELVVGHRSDFNTGAAVGVVGTLTSIVALIVTMRHR
jgi:protein involved in polysaccharide export with SLBB domain